MTETAIASSRAVVLDSGVVSLYEEEAKAAGIPVDKFIERRLQQCVNHDDERPLYFNDEQRRELEETLGGNLFKEASAVLAVLKVRYLFSLDGLRMATEADLMQAIQTRAEELHEPIKEFIKRAVMRGLRQEVGWE